LTGTSVRPAVKKTAHNPSKNERVPFTSELWPVRKY